LEIDVANDGIIFALLVIQPVLTYNSLTTLLSRSIYCRDLRTRVYSHVLIESPVFWPHPIGTAVTRTITDVEAINDIFAEEWSPSSVICSRWLPYYLWCSILRGNLHWSPFCPAAAADRSLFFQRRNPKVIHDVRNQVARLNAFLQEHISGMSVVQIFTVKSGRWKIKAINTDHRDAKHQKHLYYSIFFSCGGNYLWMASGVTVVCAYEVLKDINFGGDDPIVHHVINLIFARQDAADNQYTSNGLVASDRVFKLLDNHDKLPKQGRRSWPVKGWIEWRGLVCLWWEEFRVEKCLLTVDAGETLAIVGATGREKLHNYILSRYLWNSQGTIYLDEINILSTNFSSLRRNGVGCRMYFFFREHHG